MDADVLELVRQERILDAARLSSARGDAHGASALFERACDWPSAAVEAMRAGDGLRGLDLALRAGDEPLAEKAAAQLAVDETLADKAAAHLARRGHHGWAARVLEGAGRLAEAARAWERAGDATRAGKLFERSGNPARAARAFETALRRDAGAADAAVALAGLLIRFGKDEAGVRLLQRVPEQAPERRQALATMIGALERLDLFAAAGEAARELAALGGSPEPALATPRATFHARYEVIRQVASSPRARVLEGIDRARGDRVAIKIFTPDPRRRKEGDGVARLERDVLALRSLDHPAIVPIRDFDEQGPTVVFAWMGGGSLDQKLAQGPIAPVHAAEIACSVLGALDAAHRHGILHRDVKPANVLFDSTGTARLSDFGAAYLGDASTTVSASELDALASMSPEQREGREATARSDLFAVGAMLYEMLTGDRLGKKLRPASEGRRGLRVDHYDAIARMTAYDAEARPVDAFDARQLLLSLEWPGASDTRAQSEEPRRVVESDATAGAGTARLDQRADGRLVDAWTGHAVQRLALSDERLARARVFAQAGHVALQPVLRVDREGGFLWLASCAAIDRPLTSADRARLDDALAAVSAADGDRPTIDLGRVGLGDSGEVVLLLEPRPIVSDRRESRM
jgi:tetratricopeptide (TPR) repeat protein